jgi:hypothetical protein
VIIFIFRCIITIFLFFIGAIDSGDLIGLRILPWKKMLRLIVTYCLVYWSFRMINYQFFMTATQRLSINILSFGNFLYAAVFF